MSLFRKMKLAQKPNALSMNECQQKKIMEEAKMDRYDILGFLSGENVQLIDGETEEIENCQYSEIYEGLKLYHRQIKKSGPGDYITFLQKQSAFNPFESEPSRLVAGLGANLSKIRRMPEKVLRQWLIEYIHCLAVGKRKTEGSNVFTCQHRGIGW